MSPILKFLGKGPAAVSLVLLLGSGLAISFAAAEPSDTATNSTTSNTSAAAISSTDPAPPVPVPDDPLSRGTPRSTVERFLEAGRDGDFALAAQYLDLSELPADAQASDGPKLARQFWFVLERRENFDLRTLSRNPLGNLDDGLPPNRELLEEIQLRDGLVDATLERLRNPDGVQIWKVSAGTVQQIPKLYQHLHLRLFDVIFSEDTVNGLVKFRFLGLSGVTWIHVATIALIWAIFLIILLGLARWSLGRMRSGTTHEFLEITYVPIIVLITSGIVRGLIPEQFLSVDFESLYRAQTGLVVAAVWILIRVGDFAAVRARATLLVRDGNAGLHLVDLMQRIIRVTLVLIGLIVWLDNMGFKVTTLLASLGIIGLAVGLASKNFIEDLIGAMTLLAAGTVKRSEFIRFGNQSGVLEDIGLRMVTIRGLNRNLISMPNAAFAALEIENVTRRDKVLFAPRLGLRYETTPDQLRFVLIELRKLLYAHPKVINDGARVRFTGFGACSLDLDIFCHIGETSTEESLAVAEDLNLRIMDIVARAGTSFAFPSQTVYFERGQTPDAARAQQAESELRRWREAGQLNQDKFTEAEIKQMTGTLKYPDQGGSRTSPPEKPD